MFKKMIAGFLVLATTAVFGMSLSQLNGASKAELMEINGIGEVKAAAIIKARKHGKFKSFDDLTRVEGIGEQIASNVKNGVKVGQEPKKVKRTSKKKTTAKKAKTSKKDVEEKADKKAKKRKSKAKKSTKEKAEKKTKSKKRKIKSMDEKKKELKTKKTKAKKTKKTKSKKKN